MYKPLSAHARWIKIQSLKLAVSPHFEMNINVPVIRSHNVKLTSAQINIGVLPLMIDIRVVINPLKPNGNYMYQPL
jgi:hypothetical protein